MGSFAGGSQDSQGSYDARNTVPLVLASARSLSKLNLAKLHIFAGYGIDVNTKKINQLRVFI